MAKPAAAEAFVMYGARAISVAGATFIEQQIVAIERAIPDNPGLAIDISKAIIESTCKTILKDRGHTCEDAWDGQKLLKETMNRLRLLPDGIEDDGTGTEGLKNMLRGFTTVMQGISTVRNAHGFASHGKDARTRQLEALQAVLVARSADAVVSFLFGAHRNYVDAEPEQSQLETTYGDHPQFDEYVDDANQVVRIFDFQYRPSEVLFNVDLDAYRDLLTGYVPEETPEQAAGETDGASGVVAG